MIAQGIGQVTGRPIMGKRMVNDGGSSRVLKKQMKILKFVDSYGHLPTKP